MFTNTKEARRIGKGFQIGLISSLIFTLSACGGGGGGSHSSSSSLSSSSVSESSMSSSSASSVVDEGMTMLKTQGAQWAKASGTPVILKGTNLGNWLVQEFWMMGQGLNGITDQCTLEAELTKRFEYTEKERLMKVFHDNWIKERDWDQIQAFGFNIVRLPILWSVIEDENNHKHLRDDAWTYIDWAIAQAKARGIYVILDLHGAPGGQTPNDHTGCAGKNEYWTSADDQDRAKWLWEQIATRYKDEPAVAAYDPLNEPWGSTAEDMATRVEELYNTIRTIDDKHIVLLPSHYGDIDVYGNPADKGMTNVAFEIHPYPGLFGDRPNDSHFDIHRDWLRCGESGSDGVCYWNTKIQTLQVPLLVGEFQPWQGAGAGADDLGGKIARATYDTYASYGWAATSWAYKLVSVAGGQGQGTWGMVTNVVNTNANSGTGLIASANTWACTNWDTSLDNACSKKAASFTVGGEGSKTFYLVLKTGANNGANPDISYDKISIKNTDSQAEAVTNGDFGSDTGWTQVDVSGPVAADFNNTEAGKLPTGAEGGVLRITRPASGDGSSGEINSAIYQAVTLEGGQTYELSGLFKDNGSQNTWAEIYLVEEQPVAGTDVVDTAGKLDFTTVEESDIEALFSSYGNVAYDVNAGLAKWLVTDEHNDVFDYPERPTGVTLNQADDTASLTWTPVTGDAISYSVYRSTSAGSKGTAIANDLTATNYTDTGLDPDTTYYYSITAKNAVAESYGSTQVHTQLLYTPVPAKIEAEAFSGMSGVQLEDCTDTGGTKDVGYFDPSDWIEFQIKVETAGNFTIDYRLATANGSTGFEVLIDDQVVDTQSVPNTGGWQTWITQTGNSFAMSAGNHTLRFRSVGKEWNINWFEIKAN